MVHDSLYVGSLLVGEELKPKIPGSWQCLYLPEDKNHLETFDKAQHTCPSSEDSISVTLKGRSLN